MARKHKLKDKPKEELMGNDDFIGTIIISNEMHIDLFKVHVHEMSIRFDPKFANGIVVNENVSKEIFEIDDMWKRREIKRDDIFPLMANIVGRHELHLSDYYFETSELDKKGRYVGEIDIDTRLLGVSFEDRMKMYYSYLKGSKKMKTISKKQFEKSLSRTGASSHYLDAFESKGTTYFKYSTVDIMRKTRTCYVMIKKDTVKFAFCV